jgi:outer membrane protein assembly factor BamE (lipoprotein component of BamABCDE complex)
MSKLKSYFQFLIAILFCLVLIACSRVTQENYEKIKPNMTMQQVIAILGNPTTSESINVAGVSGTSAVWKDNKNQIDIQFLNDKVTVKTFGKIPQ